MKHLLSGLLLSSLAIALLPSQVLAALPPIYGFLMPIGGGASTGDNDVLKPAQVEIHKKALDKLQKNREDGAGIGADICLLEYRPESPDTQLGVALNRRLFAAAGADEAKIKIHYLETREKANSASIDQLDLKGCGLFYIPGGDQTSIEQLWSKTKLQIQMLENLKRGAGIMGKSAGAALQGTLVYLPRANSASSAASFMQKIQLYPDELTTEFVAQALPMLPRFYIETHTGDRERSGRALAMLAAWEARKTTKEARAMALALDSDTAVLIEFNQSLQGWTAEVVGARAVEFLIPDSQSTSSISKNGQASYVRMPSALLLSGSKMQISGSAAGKILQRRPGIRLAALPSAVSNPPCSSPFPSAILGSNEDDGEMASELTYRVVDPTSGQLVSMNEVEYAYLEGDLQSTPKSGCGYWQTHAFDLDFGRPENRLNAQRYTLGAAYADFSVSLPTLMQARSDPMGSKAMAGWIRFEPIEVGKSSSLLVFDGRVAKSRGVGTYVYQEFGATHPVQTGTWESMRVHLLLPGSHFNFETGAISF